MSRFLTCQVCKQRCTFYKRYIYDRGDVISYIRAIKDYGCTAGEEEILSSLVDNTIGTTFWAERT